MDKTIVMIDDKDMVLNYSIYELMKRYSEANEKFIVCLVEEKEFLDMQQQLNELGILSERLCRVKHFGYENLRWMAAYDINDNIIKFSDYDDFHKKGSYSLKNGVLEYDENSVSFVDEYASFRYMASTKMYTTESFNDVISFYQNKKKVLVKK